MGPLIPLVSAGVSLATGIFGASRAAKAQRKAEAEEKKKRAEMDRLKGVYANLDTSNPFLNMENTMEDLTVNQQQAQFESQQFQQSQANIMSGLRGSAGGSGIAALAQTLAQQGQLNAQRSSASIGRQESANQMAAARQAGTIQMQERRGEVKSRQMKRDQASTLLGMSQQETAAARNQASMAEQAKWSAISGGIQGAVGSVGSGMQSGAFSEWGIEGIGS
tara:strand:- start:390 stop:1052 length:663 start_codon:yes stop_codon:yes gene_type:complete